MTTCRLRFDNRDRQRSVDPELLTPQEQVPGLLIVILLCLSATLIRSL